MMYKNYLLCMNNQPMPGTDDETGDSGEKGK